MQRFSRIFFQAFFSYFPFFPQVLSRAKLGIERGAGQKKSQQIIFMRLVWIDNVPSMSEITFSLGVGLGFPRFCKVGFAVGECSARNPPRSRSCCGATVSTDRLPNDYRVHPPTSSSLPCNALAIHAVRVCPLNAYWPEPPYPSDLFFC